MRGENTDAQPCGVTTPQAQSPLALATTWSAKMGVVTRPPALTVWEMPRARSAAERRDVAENCIFLLFFFFSL